MTRYAVEVAEIQWDTDGEEVPDLPRTMSFEVDVPTDDPSEMEINDAVTDHMSDATGWCVGGFVFAKTERLDVPSPGPA